ncbi:MAG: hypothetical protein L0216_21065 [Planctomycetales bacterium]|nr:hypothetical protein [Planctomycetales bacterium]
MATGSRVAYNSRRVILGLNVFHGDSSVATIRGDWRAPEVAGIEEERLRRVKHWAGFPEQALRALAGGAADPPIRAAAVGRKPSAQLFRKVLHALSGAAPLAKVLDRVRNVARVRSLEERIRAALPPGRLAPGFGVVPVEHHRAHLASAFLCSPFERAALCSVDGFGDFVSTMRGIGEGSRIRVLDSTPFPHSPGIFYLAVTQYLGFPKYGDEYKVMGLAATGEPRLLPRMREVIRHDGRGRIRLDLACFRHHDEGVAMTWDDCEPKIGPVFSDEFLRRFGPARMPDDPLEDRHREVAASAQAAYEEAFHDLLRDLHARTKERRLCLAGGCALNSVANGKIFEKTPFTDVFIQPAAGDAGTALGAALWLRHCVEGLPRDWVMARADLGPEYAPAEIRALLESRGEKAQELSRADLLATVAGAVAAGKVVGWFQGRMEWGPRALGHRSILADPRRPGMKDLLNERIKRRETFRPFAPSILLERLADYFVIDHPDPFMLKVYPVRPAAQALVPATTHVDGTGRLQTVSRDEDPLYHDLIAEFERLTGVPVVLNTSFNENEPIVCRPEEALDCFLRTRMDALALGPFWLEKPGAAPEPPPLTPEAARLAREPAAAR